MIPGYNSSVTRAGVEYHVQSEDLGRKNPCILTLVYRGGAIVHREKVDYREALGVEAPAPSAVRVFMDAQHRRIMAAVAAGTLPAPPAAS
jgi:hypothetical protein